jgi:hypothetical protein
MPFTRGAVLLNRIQPGLPPQSYKSYEMRYPLRTHWRKATCEEVECDHWVMGWDTLIDTSTDLGQRQYDYCHGDRSRSFTEKREGLTIVRFHYGPGNQPFPGPRHDHRVKVERPPLFVVSGGDWRGNPRGTDPVLHRNGENWADDFATHQDALERAGR